MLRTAGLEPVAHEFATTFSPGLAGSDWNPVMPEWPRATRPTGCAGSPVGALALEAGGVARPAPEGVLTFAPVPAHAVRTVRAPATMAAADAPDGLAMAHLPSHAACHHATSGRLCGRRPYFVFRSIR